MNDDVGVSQPRPEPAAELRPEEPSPVAAPRPAPEAAPAPRLDESDVNVLDNAEHILAGWLAEAEQRLGQAEADAERVRLEAESERARILAEARAHAETQVAAIRAEAEASRDRLLEEARAQALYEASRIREQAAREIAELRAQAEGREANGGRKPRNLVPIHSSEIEGRPFPRAWRGLDAEAVRKWLSLVALSHGVLEDELEGSRADWDAAVEALGNVRALLMGRDAGPEPSSEWDRAGLALGEWRRGADALARARRWQGGGSSFETLLVRTAVLEAPISRRPLGYSRSQVRRLLDASATQLARLENQAALLRSENDELRSRLLGHVADPAPLEWAILPGAPGDQRPSGRVAPDDVGWQAGAEA